MRRLDLNCDMGELKPGQTANYDADLMPFISSCSIACGGHSGNAALMARTVDLALENGLNIGAHPSYVDRENFGRKSVRVERDELLGQIEGQINVLREIAAQQGAQLHHVKAHGALYNDMLADRELALDFVRLVKRIDPGLAIYTMAGSSMVEICKAAGMKAVHESFSDRRYESAHRLQSRSIKGAVLHDEKEVLAQVDDFLNGQVRLADGTLHNIAVESICLHSDTPGAVKLGKLIHAHLKQKHVQIAAVR